MNATKPSKAADNAADITAPAASDGKPAPRVLRIETPALIPTAPEVRRWYWIGLLPEAPQNCQTVGGLAFCKRTETVHRATRGEMKCTRIPRAGEVVALTDSKLQIVADMIARHIVRPIRPQAENIPGSIDMSRGGGGRQTAVVLRVPTPEEDQAFAEHFYKRRPFEARAGDRPFAEFVYCVPVIDGPVRPRSIDVELPDPVSKTGIALSAGLVCDEHRIVGAGFDDVDALLR